MDSSEVGNNFQPFEVANIGDENLNDTELLDRNPDESEYKKTNHLIV